ncbi:MAG: delta-60 repeat domain-containing protein [Acidimicrobiales bacterium]
MTWARPAVAAPGDLDTTFSGDGRVTANPTTARDAVYGVAVQDDGRIVVAGEAGGAAGRFGVSRYTTDGTLDPTFSGDGRVFTNFTSNNDAAFAVAIQPDGKIVAAGFSNGGPHSRIALARYTTAGALDPSFGGGDGKVSTDHVTADEHAYDIELQDDGRIVVVGDAVAGTSVVTALARYTTSGGVDTTFGGDGLVTTNVGPGPETGQAVAVQDDGAVVVTGLIGTNGSERTFVLRYTASGAPDASWNGNGRVVRNLINGYEDAVAVAIQDDGAVVAAGEVNGQLSVLRFLPTGAADASFSGDGRVVTNLPGGYEWISGIAIQDDGRIVVAGRIAGTGGRAMVARYDTSGTLDATFSGDGFTAIDFTAGWDYATNVAVASNGDIIISASVNDGALAGVARLLGT